MTYKKKFNILFDLPEDTSNSLEDMSKLTGIPKSILEQVEDRGKGAYSSNLGSVRLKDFSKNPSASKGPSKRLSQEQWAIARVYAFLYKSIKQKMRYKPHDKDLYKEIQPQLKKIREKLNID